MNMDCDETYRAGQQIARQLGELATDVSQIDASDTVTKQQALQLIQEARDRLRQALTALAGLV
jgi:predicted NBD/HSP70 family sugar kinase